MRSLVVPVALGIGLVGLMPRVLSAAPPEARPATIVVHLPADARLTIDGAPTKATSAQRSFITPPLEAGKTFSYTFEAQFVRGNQSIRVTEEVPIRAGAKVALTLGQPWLPVSSPRPVYGYGAVLRTEAPAVSQPSASGFRSHFRDMRQDEDGVRD